MQTQNNANCETADTEISISEREKTEIYAALYSLNSGIHQVLNSIDYLDRYDLGLPFLNGYRILAEEIRRVVNFTAAEALSMFEIQGYRARQQTVNISRNVES